jgi:alkylated DNA repair protein (DNA oxidative demethylase)
MKTTLFEGIPEQAQTADDLGPGVTMLRGFALDGETALLDALFNIAERSPFRHMVIPGGFRMSVAMTNCGSLGWVADRRGYRYDAVDPQTQEAWPTMPDAFLQVAINAASLGGFPKFVPDACLINRYEPGARLTLHQDKNERDFAAPIVSVSLGLPAVFQLGGVSRTDRTIRLQVVHGDVLVWGGPARLRYHGLMPLKPGCHALTGEYRFNLTFRKAA